MHIIHPIQPTARNKFHLTPKNHHVPAEFVSNLVIILHILLVEHGHGVPGRFQLSGIPKSAAHLCQPNDSLRRTPLIFALRRERDAWEKRALCVKPLSVFSTRIKTSSDYTHRMSATVCVRSHCFNRWVETSKPHMGEGNRGFVKASTAIGVAKWTAQLDMCVWGPARDHT